MKKIIILSLLALMAASGLILTGCRKQADELSSYNPIGNTKNDSLRIYNLLPDISNDGNNDGYLIYLNDSLNLYTGMSLYGQIGYGAKPVLTVPASGGTYTIKLAKFAYPCCTPATAPAKNPPVSAIVCQKTITLPPHSGFGNVIFYDSLGTIPAVKYLPCTTVDPGAPAAGNFKIRIVNFSYAMAGIGPLSPNQSAGPQYNLQLQYRDSTALTGDENVPFGGVSNYQEMDYGTEQFLVYNLTTKAYINNCGPLNDMGRTFDLYPVPTYPTYPSNRVFPMESDYTQNYNTATLETGNIGSYPFSPGGVYTVFVIGNMYAVALDRRYGAGVLDNVGKVQIVNANPNQQDMEVKIAYSGGGLTDIPSLPFGKSANPLTVPAGPVTFTFLSQGQTLYSTTEQVARLGDYTYYYTADNNTLPILFPQSNIIVQTDYFYGGYSGPALIQLIKINGLDLAPDAGALFFTVQTAISKGVDAKFNSMSTDLSYKGIAQSIGTSNTLLTLNYATYDGTLPPTALNIRLSSSRPDSLAGKLVATLPSPFNPLPAPGNYTMLAAGLLNTTDPAKKMKLILVKHTNFTSKAK